MKSISLALTGMVLTGVIFGADAAPPAVTPADAWIATFRNYAAQESVPRHATPPERAASAKRVRLEDVVRALPAPPDWPKLRLALTEAGKQLPPGRKLEHQRLQAGSWLLTWLVGDRVALEKEVGAAMAAAGNAENNPLAGFLKEMHDSLVPPVVQADTVPASQVEEFEQELTLLEPLDDATVKQAVGGEQNFARLKHLADLACEMQAKGQVIEKEFGANTDQAAAQKKAEALELEYAGKIKADQEVLAPYLENPAVEHYFTNRMQEGSAAGSNDAIPVLTVPDLVPVLGPERATALVRRALRIPVRLSLPIEGPMSDATRHLVREVVMADMGTLKAPSWGLVEDEDSGALFEAMHRKFPRVASGDDEYRSACGYYLMGLIQQGRSDSAVQFASGLSASGPGEQKADLPFEAMERLESTKPEELWKFLRAWLAVNPAAGEWDRFNRLSALLDHRAELRALLKTLADSGAFKGLERLTVQHLQADAELAAGDFAAAAAHMHEMVMTPAETEQERKVQSEEVGRLLELVDLEGDAAGYVSALAAAEALMAKNHADKPANASSEIESLISKLNDLGHYADSVRLGHVALAWAADLEQSAAVKNGHRRGFQSAAISPDFPAELLRAEVELGHWPEARAVLSDNPWWDTGDIAGLLDRKLSSAGKPPDYYVARTVQSGGDLALARRILEAQLVATPGSDGVYELYLEVAGREALPLLERLAVADRYEERPLIWKARVQMDAREWDAAIVTLQQAITIDPSDGEEGRGDRMRVYAFMSLALAAKGDAQKAAFFANVVKAIRLSETADRWYGIRAYAKAIELYRQALGFFQDAYCIQSRLAIRLAEAGKMDEAAEHYRRAFELMPDSFGRVESHCFGCEHVFAGKKSQGVADEVFARMLQARPDKPQLYYLTGYLREEQDRYPEAAELYRHAGQLDPLYLNAWKRLADLDGKVPFTSTQRDDLLLKLAELDPAERHVSPELEKVSDLPRLWRVLKDNTAVLKSLPERTALGELRASAARLSPKYQGNTPAWGIHPRQKDFAVIVLKSDFIRALQSYIYSLDMPAEPAEAEPAPASEATTPSPPEAHG